MNNRIQRNSLIGLLAWATAACSTLPVPKAIPASEYLATQEETGEGAAPAPIESQNENQTELSSLDPGPYRLGPGDRIQIRAIGSEECDGIYQLGPDGALSVPLLGPLQLSGLTREEALGQLKGKLDPLYKRPPLVNLDVVEYANNRVFVLGNVLRPGPVDLDGPGDLLQVLSEAGGLTQKDLHSGTSYCSIIRGREILFRVDLSALLVGGNINLNLRLASNDVVYVPSIATPTVFVMGEVSRPGAIPIQTQLCLSQALALAGGPAEDADLTRVYLVREGQDEKPILVNFARLLATGDRSEDLNIRSGDILFVARTGLGDVSYFLRKIMPGLQGAVLGAALND